MKYKTTIKTSERLKEDIKAYCAANKITVSKFIENFLLITVLDDEECRKYLKEERQGVKYVHP